MKKLFFSLSLCLASMALWAVPATPYPFEVEQPDGSKIMVRLHGDEYHSFYTTLDGKLLKRNRSGYWVVSSTPVAEVRQEGAALRKAARIKDKQNIPSNYPLVGSPKALVLLVGFKDTPFQQELKDFDALLNQSGYSHNGAMGSCRDYYIAASDSVFQPQFDAYGPFVVSKNLEYYGGAEGKYNDRRPYEMIIEACQLAHASGVDLKQYDTDKDGVLDNVFVFYAGYNESEGASSENIWPHKSDVSQLDVTVDGLQLAAYACTSEHSGTNGNVRAGIGTFCHEFGHVLGLPDLYDTEYKHYSVANWSIMCSGSHTDNGRTPPTYSAYERFYLGWLKPKQLEDNGQYTLLPLGEENEAYLIANRTHNLQGKNPNPAEFFMLEYRRKTGWDTYLPGEGMVVWHIDFLQAAWDNNTPNNNSNLLRVHLEEANGIYWNQRANGDRGLASDTYPGTKNVTSFVPKLHDGTVLSEQNVFDITDHDGLMSFIYGGLGDVRISTDVSELYFVTTVSDDKKIVDWTPQAILLTTQALHSDTLFITSKGNFRFAVADEAPARGSKEWSKSLSWVVDNRDMYAQKIWVSFNPSKQSCDEVKGTLSISTVGATSMVSLTGTSPRPVYITKPILKPATHVTPYSFRMAWKPVQDAVLYYVTLYQATEGMAAFMQGFEQFADADAVANEGWQSNVNRVTTTAKSEGTKALYFRNTGEYILSETYLAPITSISFWLNAFGDGSVDSVGELHVEAWNGVAWKTLENGVIPVLSTTKRKTMSYTFSVEDAFTQFRITYVHKGGKGVAMDAFVANCSQNISYLYRGKELTVDAYEDEALCSYEITNVASGATFYYCLQSSDITKGCEEHISDLSAPMKVTTLTVGEEQESTNELPMVIDTIQYDAPTHVVYLSSPQNGDMLHVYDAMGKLVYSCHVYDGVSDYVIPNQRMQKGTLYVIKHITNGKLKRKQGWAKFIY